MKDVRFRRWIIILAMFLSFFPLMGNGEEKRIIPVDYKSCGPGRNSTTSATHLWDNMEDQDHKWCCFHAGYVVPQTHWVIMDLGAVYPISRIVVVHEGDESVNRHVLTEDYKLFGSATSMQGPWALIQDIFDNTQKKNEILLPNTKVRYLGIEVTDPQLGVGANKKQDDWAVRITEIYIYTQLMSSPLAKPGSSLDNSPFKLSPRKSVQATHVTPIRAGASIQPGPSSPAAFAPNNPFQLPGTSSSRMSPASSPSTAGQSKKLLCFTNPGVPNCAKLNQVLASPRVKTALQSYQLQMIQPGANNNLFSQYSVFMVPTLIITDSQGNVIKRSSSIRLEQDLLAFLR